MKVRKKPIILEAEFAEEPGTINTLEGDLHYSKGDAIITGTHGEKWPVRRLLFNETYEILETNQHPVVCECGMKADEIWSCNRSKCPFYPRSKL